MSCIMVGLASFAAIVGRLATHARRALRPLPFGFVFRRRERHAGHRFDPDEMIVHLFDAGDVLGRDDERLALAFVGDRAPQLRDAVLDDDVDVRRPVLLAKRPPESRRGLPTSLPAGGCASRARLTSACIRLARLTMPTTRRRA